MEIRIVVVFVTAKAGDQAPAAVVLALLWLLQVSGGGR
jgi:hypothetical protein